MADKEIEVGTVEDFFQNRCVASIRIDTVGIKVGDVLHIKGHTTDALLEVASLQVDHSQIKKARAGETVAIKVNERVRPNDHVFKVILKEPY